LIGVIVFIVLVIYRKKNARKIILKTKNITPEQNS